MTKERKIIQVALISIGFFLIITTYFLYPTINKERLKKSVIDDDLVEEIEDQSDDKDSSFENVEYKGFYDFDKPFVILSKKANISAKDSDIVYMKDMKVTLNLGGGRVITITSDEGIYNKVTYDCFFEKNVMATDGETEILSGNLDLIASKDYATIYNDVKLTNDNGSLRADKVEYNFEAKYYKISMFQDEKVKIKLNK